jgi:hypothetical protein
MQPCIVGKLEHAAGLSSMHWMNESAVPCTLINLFAG